jgi:hypothetical protein
MNTKLIENKILYKLFLSIIKFTPIIITIVHTVALILHYVGIPSTLLSCFGGISILFLIILYIISYVFKFCYLYRVPLWYVTVIVLVNVIQLLGVGITTINLYRIYTIIFGFFLIVFIIYMYKNRKNPKIDHIKQLCDKYIDCSC